MMKTIQHIVKVEGQIKEREKLLKWFNRLLDKMPDGEIVLEIKPTDITDAQRRYYWSQINQMAASTGGDSQDLHRRFKMLFFPADMLELGKTSLNDLDKEQMSAFLENCIRVSAEYYQWGDPEEYKHIQ